MLISFCKRFFFCNAHERKTMFIELMVELISFIGEIVFEGFLEFAIDFASDLFAKRRR